MQSSLIDNYGRQIRYLRVSVTDRCNLRCQYCMPAEGLESIPHDSIMRYEELEAVIRAFVAQGVDKVRLTGGEPLVRRGIVDFVARLREIETIKDLSMTTNGLLLKEMAVPLRQAGLMRLNISLDTLNAERFRYITRSDKFSRVMGGLEAALNAGFDQIKINVVAMRGVNDDEIAEFAALSIDKPLQVRFIELMPMGCATRFNDASLIEAAEIRRRIEAVYGPLEAINYFDGPASVMRIRGAAGTIGLIKPYSEESFCSRCNRVRLTANGFIRPCLFSDNQIDVLTPLRAGDGDLDSLVLRAIAEKPQAHLRSDGHLVASCNGRMNKIGG